MKFDHERADESSKRKSMNLANTSSKDRKDRMGSSSDHSVTGLFAVIILTPKQLVHTFATTL